MITVRDDGLIIFDRCEFLYRTGELDPNQKMSDGAILAHICPGEGRAGAVDIRDAKTIAAFLNTIAEEWRKAHTRGS